MSSQLPPATLRTGGSDAPILPSLSPADAKQLRKNLDEALAQRSAYEETTLCIARLWDRLLSDVDLLAARAGLPAGTEEPSPATDGSAAPPEDLDPFLHRLLRGRPLRDNVPSDSRKRKRTEPELPVSSLEEKLRQRFGSTTSKLARVLDALDKGAGAAAGATSKADADAAYAR